METFVLTLIENNPEVRTKLEHNEFDEGFIRSLVDDINSSNDYFIVDAYDVVRALMLMKCQCA